MSDNRNETDVVDVLTSDHGEMVELIGQIRAAEISERKRDLTDTLISEIVWHAVAEEMYVYPEMREHLPDGDEGVEHDIEEHKDIECVMKELESVEAGDARFVDELRDLEDKLTHRAGNEEIKQFPHLRAKVPRGTPVKIAEQVELAKKIAPTRPHPMAPNSPLLHKVVGPGVGLVDRLRDKLTGRTAHG